MHDVMSNISDTPPASPAKDLQMIDNEDDGGTERWLEHLASGGDAEGGTLNHFWRFQVRFRASSTPVVSSSARPSVELPHGREAEIAAIGRAIELFFHMGKPTLLIIEGASQTGKSFLVKHAINRIEGPHVLRHVPIDIYQCHPFSGLSELFMSLLTLRDHSEVPSGSGSAKPPLPYAMTEQEKLRKCVTDALELIDDSRKRHSLRRGLPLLNAILPVAIPSKENELHTAISVLPPGQYRISRTIDFLVELVQAVLDPTLPHIFVIDDAHLLDTASWSLLSKIGSKCRVLMFVVMEPVVDRSRYPFSVAHGEALVMRATVACTQVPQHADPQVPCRCGRWADTGQRSPCRCDPIYRAEALRRARAG
jgi:hypothetical protein